MRLIDADALIKEIEMDIEDVGLQEKMVFYRINEALQAEPSDGDLISRQDAIDAVASRDETNGTVKVFTGRQVNEILAELPSASVEVGEWVEEDEYGDLWVCDQCGFASEYKSNFCPNCGAMMYKGGDNE